jgi:purine/pyrimidine-nucleoside phosphorylase
MDYKFAGRRQQFWFRMLQIIILSYGGSMLQVNEYFSGKVKSIGFAGSTAAMTVGVMEAGEYQFNTGKPEQMVIIDGHMTVKLPGSDKWETFYSPGGFAVPGNASFSIILTSPCAYLCKFIEVE